MAIKEDYQKLEAGSLVTLIELDCSEFGGEVLYFHGHNVNFSQSALESHIESGDLKWEQANGVPIVWGGIKYHPWPCQVEGISADSSGAPSSPTLSVGNVDGTISSLCLYFDDLVQAKVTIRYTMSKYLDPENFEGGVNPSADSSQEVKEVWYIDSKTREDSLTISWNLNSPADVSGQIIPARLITSLCEWSMTNGYRGSDCGYRGDAMYDKDDNPTDDPSKDTCSGYLSSCKRRFGEEEQLGFGGFPAANLLGR